MSGKPSLKQKFTKHMIGSMTGALTGLAVAVSSLGAAAPAQAQQSYTTQDDIHNFGIIAADLDHKYENITPRQATTINTLYKQMQEEYLADPSHPNLQGYISAITADAAALANAYGMGNDPAFTGLISAVGLHSNLAETFYTLTGQNMGQSIELADATHEDFLGLKFQAMVDTQYRLSHFLERTAAKMTEQDFVAAEDFSTFSHLCHMSRSHETAMKDLHMAILPANNIGNPNDRAMTAEDPTTNYTRPLDCDHVPGFGQ